MTTPRAAENSEVLTDFPSTSTSETVPRSSNDLPSTSSGTESQPDNQQSSLMTPNASKTPNRGASTPTSQVVLESSCDNIISRNDESTEERRITESSRIQQIVHGRLDSLLGNETVPRLVAAFSLFRFNPFVIVQSILTLLVSAVQFLKVVYDFYNKNFIRIFHNTVTGLLFVDSRVLDYAINMIELGSTRTLMYHITSSLLVVFSCLGALVGSIGVVELIRILIVMVKQRWNSSTLQTTPRAAENSEVMTDSPSTSTSETVPRSSNDLPSTVSGTESQPDNQQSSLMTRNASETPNRGASTLTSQVVLESSCDSIISRNDESTEERRITEASRAQQTLHDPQTVTTSSHVANSERERKNGSHRITMDHS